eukprot:g80148.t1
MHELEEEALKNYSSSMQLKYMHVQTHNHTNHSKCKLHKPLKIPPRFAAFCVLDTYNELKEVTGGDPTGVSGPNSFLVFLCGFPCFSVRKSLSNARVALTAPLAP